MMLNRENYFIVRELAPIPVIKKECWQQLYSLM